MSNRVGVQRETRSHPDGVVPIQEIVTPEELREAKDFRFETAIEEARMRVAAEAAERWLKHVEALETVRAISQGHSAAAATIIARASQQYLLALNKVETTAARWRVMQAERERLGERITIWLGLVGLKRAGAA
jgi:hypothetical protein